jgi:hypothetical protein
MIDGLLQRTVMLMLYLSCIELNNDSRSRVEADSNTSTVSLRVVGGDEK